MSDSTSLKRAALHRLRQVPAYAGIAMRKLSSGSRCLPNAIIVGAQKSGTSSLFSYLTQHPQIHGSSRKEVHYFDSGYDPQVDSYARGHRWYRAHFPLEKRVAPGDMIIEATPSYLFIPNVPQRIASLIPDAKIIAVLRDPVDRAISDYFHEVRAGRESRSIGEALEKEEEILSPIWTSGNYKLPEFIHCSYKARGRYAEQLSRYFGIFPRKQVLVLSSKALFEDTASTLARIFDFLGVDPTIRVADTSPRNVGSSKPDIDGAVREYLTEYFRPFNEELFDMLEERVAW